jgi:peptidoglycan/LPS O-acetylase OafA/YrhL
VKRKSTGLLTFYKNHLSKLYLNYWLIAAIFVPVGIFLMNYPLSKAYINHEYLKFIIQLTGLHRWFYPDLGYNPTWWYLSTIIPLYVLFPLMYRLTRKTGVWPFLFLCIAGFLIQERLFFSELVEHTHFVLWSSSFVLGIDLSLSNGLATASLLLSRTGWFRFVLLAASIIGLSIFEKFGFIYYLKLAWLLGTLIIRFTFEVVRASSLLSKILSFLGKHLFNIFLFHTFIFYFFFKEQIYSFKNPLLIFAVLLSVCLLISILIEYLKKAILFYRLESKISEIRINDKLFI